MNRLSHIVFAFSLFVALYSLIFAFSVWFSDVGQLSQFAFYYLAGGLSVSLVFTPILYWKAPHKESTRRTSSNRGAFGAMFFVMFCIGSLVGSTIYQYLTGVVMIGSVSIFIGALITMSGALIPDWDIIFLGISRHRNIIFHSIIVPLLIVLGTLVNAGYAVVSSSSFAIGTHIEYYIAALFLIGYASHLYLDIFPSDASPLEILWRAMNPDDKAPTGLKSLGPFRISKDNARAWLVGNATILILFAIGLLGLYFYNLSLLMP